MPVFERPLIGPILLGACIVGGLVLMRIAVVLPWAIVLGAWGTLIGALKAIGAGMIGGAMGGLGYVLLGRGLRSIPVLGRYLAGIATVGAYLGSLALVIPWIDADMARYFRAPDGLYVLAAGSLLGGIALARSVFSD